MYQAVPKQLKLDSTGKGVNNPGCLFSYSIKPVCYIDTPRGALGASIHAVVSLKMNILNRNYLILYTIVLREKYLAVTASGFFYFSRFNDDTAVLCLVFRYTLPFASLLDAGLNPAKALKAYRH